MVDRRRFLRVTASASASLAFAPSWATVAAWGRTPRAPLLQRAIPSSGEQLPVIGLSFSNHTACADRAALRDVVKTLVDHGGTVFDAMHGNAEAETVHAALATELGVQDRLFWSTRGVVPGGPGGPPTGGADAVRSHIDTWLARIRASQMDLVMLPAHSDAAWLRALLDEKRAGRVRYVGVQVLSDNTYPQLETVMRTEPIDFVGVDYDVSNRRRVEDTILPLALERRIAVMALFPFGNNGGLSCGSGSNLFARVGTRPLPDWAAEFDATSWAHFFLKYVLGHPAITVARVGTTKPHHMLDNLGGGVGRLPNEAMRQRMAALIDALPPVTVAGSSPALSSHGPPGSLVLPPAVLDRYVGDYRTTNGTDLTFRRYGTMLVVRIGADRDMVIYGISDTRFRVGRDILEFQLGSSGRAERLRIQQGDQLIDAPRIR